MRLVVQVHENQLGELRHAEVEGQTDKPEAFFLCDLVKNSATIQFQALRFFVQ